MKNENVVQTKSYGFAVKVVKVCWQIQQEKKEFVLSKQLLRSSTSIGANIEEAIGGQTKKDFFAKRMRPTKCMFPLNVDPFIFVTKM